MLSMENLVPNDKGVVPFPPHVMFYGSHGSQSGPAFVVNEGAPQALVIVPVVTHTGPGHAAAGKSTGSPQ